jgi:molybdate transport system permease protein
MGVGSTVDWFPLWLSLRVAALATILVVTAGTAVAYVLSQRAFRGKDFVDSVITLPLVLPPTVLGYYLLVLLGRPSPLGRAYEALFGTPLVFTWQAAVVAALFHSGPLFIKAATAALNSVDSRYIYAARSLGASPWRTFFRVTLPLAANQIAALGALAFARSLGDFGVTMMVAGNIPGKTQTLSIAIYDAVESGDGRLARILVVIVSLTAIAILWPSNTIVRRSWLRGADES